MQNLIGTIQFSHTILVIGKKTSIISMFQVSYHQYYIYELTDAVETNANKSIQGKYWLDNKNKNVLCFFHQLNAVCYSYIASAPCCMVRHILCMYSQTCLTRTHL